MTKTDKNSIWKRSLAMMLTMLMLVSCTCATALAEAEEGSCAARFSLFWWWLRLPSSLPCF